jgi:methylenetetrahydrofolate reductase (NADPH)
MTSPASALPTRQETGLAHAQPGSRPQAEQDDSRSKAATLPRMKIVDALNSPGPEFSFEFFPPKTDEGAEQLYRTIQTLKPLDPTFVSVTDRAGGNFRRRTVELTERIKKEIGIETMAHLTCVASTRDDLAATLDDLYARGVENILALRGDPLEGDEFVPAEGGFAHANELISFIRTRYDVCIGVAGYPEGHPEAPSMRRDLENLKRKIDAGADFIISQLFFDNADFLRFRQLAEYEGIHAPILAGIMPILNVKQIKRFTQICGAKIPKELLRAIEAVEDDDEAVRHVGMYHATKQCRDLLDAGVAGLHFYTLNRSTATRAIFQYLKAVHEG